MKLSALALLAIALAAGLTQAAAQDGKPMPQPIPKLRPRVSDVPPPPESTEPEDTQLGANYRIVISATANGSKMGELMALSCTSPFQLNGYLVRPTAEDPFGASLVLRGALAEAEGGSLKLSYSMLVNVPVPLQSISALGGGAAVTSTHSYKRTGATGILLLKPGQSCEVVKISGVAYSVSITPTETPPAPKPEPAAKQPADAPAAPQPSDESNRPENSQPKAAARGGPTAEDRARYEKMSDRAKEQFREAMREVFRQETFRNSPEEERRAQIRKIYEKVEAEDQARNK